MAALSKSTAKKMQTTIYFLIDQNKNKLKKNKIDLPPPQKKKMKRTAENVGRIAN